ncbi:hypothetical protein BH09PSE3_BH09PSE3_27400 [soil metagenome]
MMDTESLIIGLAANGAPVRRLQPPLVRAAIWLLLAGAVMGILCLSKGLRPGFFSRFSDLQFSINMAASTATGILATISAFLLSVPDRSNRWILLPLPSMAVWLGNIGYQCLAGWVAVPPGSLTVEAASSCFSTLALAGAPLSLAMVVMLRHTVAFRPSLTTIAGSVAVSAISASTLAMIHPLDATAMILGWNLGIATMYATIAALIYHFRGRRKWHQNH